MARPVTTVKRKPSHVAVSTTLVADGKPLAAMVTRHQVEAMRQPRRGTSSRDNRVAPSMPSQAVGNR